MKNFKTLSFSIDIKSERGKYEKYFGITQTYQEWTRVFTEGSHYKGELMQGNKIQFLGKDGDGMSSIVEKLLENEQMVFAHQKELKNGVETDSTWEGAKEIYYLKKDLDTGTELQVIMDITLDMEASFNKTFPKALALVKQLSEQN